MQFGKVYLAAYPFANESTPREVAVKLMKVNATAAEREDFLGEAELMLMLDHPKMLKVWCHHK